MGAIGELPTLPRDARAEQSLIGCALNDAATLTSAAGIEPRHFYTEGHDCIWRAILALVAADQQVHVDAVEDWLVAAGIDEAAYGGPVYLRQLSGCVLSPSRVVAAVAAASVREKALLREALFGLEASAALARTGDAAKAAQTAEEFIGRLREADKPAQAGPPPLPRRMPQALDLAALAGRKPPPRPWVRAAWLGYEPTVLAGAGGSGKSSLMQHEATAGALGRAYFAPECDPYTALVLNCEDEHDDLWRRQERICEHEGIDMADLADRLHIVSRYGCENALMAQGQYGVLGTTRLLEELRQQVNDLHVTGLFLDNAAHLLAANHDDRTVVTAFMNALAGLVTDRPFFFVIAGHTARSAGSEFSGSAAWENAARMRWFLGSQLPDQKADESDEPRADVRFLCKRKSNYSAQDYVRFTMRDGLLVPDEGARTHVGGLVAAIDERKAEEVCIAGFRSLCALGIAPTDAKNSPDYLPGHIVTKGFSAGFNKNDLARAMNRLMGRGRFVRGVVGQYAGNRNPRMGLVLQEDGGARCTK